MMEVLMSVLGIAVSAALVFAVPAVLHCGWFRVVLPVGQGVPWRRVFGLSLVIGLVAAAVSVAWGPAFFLVWFGWLGFWLVRLVVACARALNRSMRARRVEREIDRLERVINGG